MTKLEELIKKLCPNGVEFVELGTITDLHKGIQFNKANMAKEGSYPVINGGIEPSGYIEQFNENEYTITISQGGASAGYVNWLGTKFWAGAHCYIIKPLNEEKLLNRYLYHFIKNKEEQLRKCQYGAGIPALGKETISNLLIPLPPLAVQREIVRILDEFTLLSAELVAELVARCKQYEFYRDKLLTFENKIEYMTVRDVIVGLKTGLNPRQNFKLNVEGAICNYITGKDILNNSICISDRTDKITKEIVALINKRSCLQDNILLFASTGTGTVGRMAIVDHYDELWNVSETLYCIKTKDSVLVKYLMYILYSQQAKMQFEPKISKGSVPHLKVEDLLNVKIPVPPLEVQERIVKVLDNFDAICSDLKIGLPAEIEARKKQYEYYRDKLLTFDLLITEKHGGGR